MTSSKIGKGIIAIRYISLYICKGDFQMTARSKKILSDEWKQVPWDDFQRMLYRLQHRIYKTAKKNEIKSVRKLQRLILDSYCARYLAIRQVGKLYITNKAEFEYSDYQFSMYKSLKLLFKVLDTKNFSYKRVFISDNPLTIEIVNKAIFLLIVYAIEPIYEAYIFQDTLRNNPLYLRNQVLSNLKLKANDNSVRILKVDIKNCLDNLNHDKFLSFFILPKRIKKFLTSNFVFSLLKKRKLKVEGKLFNLCLKIVLRGIENIFENQEPRHEFTKTGFRNSFCILFFLERGVSSKKLTANLFRFIRSAGLNPKKAKFSFLDLTSGFDFSGWHFQLKLKNKVVVYYPSRKTRLNIIFRLKKTLKDVRYKLENRLWRAKLLYNIWVKENYPVDSYRVNLWFIKRWIYKYIKKASKISNKVAIEYVKEIFR
jgi:hypothetical protein